ncbi:hypothetical protein Leryth_015478 [Lithospermum erythrorhizon]|nr:hypothetical protein Leryth_015478 [Lithospermum erythrorhizon]
MASSTIPAKLTCKKSELKGHATYLSEHCFHTGKISKKNPKVLLAQDRVDNLNFIDDKSVDNEFGGEIMINTTALMQTSDTNQVKEEPMAKMRNLRPRRAMKKKSLNGKDGVVEKGIESIPEKKDELLKQENVEKFNGVEKVKKVKFSVSLTRQEIEEDVYAFTGLRAARRPKRKRAKAVQKNLDNVFPGLWLKDVRPDSYKVHEHSMKG